VSVTLCLMVGWLGMIQGGKFWSEGGRLLAVLMMVPSVILWIYGVAVFFARLAQVPA
jgi:hypothetical protein